MVEKMSSEEQTGGGRGQLVTETRKEGKKNLTAEVRWWKKMEMKNVRFKGRTIKGELLIISTVVL